ncbi:MAG: GDSL-type esterase/lipase family protein, partial [Planctomycetota bacterium]
MLSLTSALFAALGFSSCMTPSTDTPEFTAGRASAQAFGSSVEIPYRLLAPSRIEEGKRYPVILFLHGAGERGDDNELQLKHFPERMVTRERMESFPCFLIAPQCPAGGRWTTDGWGSKNSQRLPSEMTPPMAAAVQALLDVCATYPIDLDRVYLTGLSMGGYGTFELATRFPDWFAAVAAVCGGGDEKSADRLVGLPLSIWHGDRDDAVPVERSRAMMEALKAMGGDGLASYRELKDVGHDSWTAAYGDDGCLEWMFAQRRDPLRRAKALGELMARSLRANERLAFLGDSITQAGAEKGGYVDVLRGTLQAVRPEAKVIPAGISGHKVPDLLGREKRDVRDQNASLVFVYIGINDVWHSTSGRGTPKDAFASGMEELVGRLEGDGGATLALATPSVIGEGPLGAGSLDGMLGEYAAITRKLTGAERPLCDLQVRFRDHLRLFNP